jgi:hypothetical protein
VIELRLQIAVLVDRPTPQCVDPFGVPANFVGLSHDLPTLSAVDFGRSVCFGLRDPGLRLRDRRFQALDFTN